MTMKKVSIKQRGFTGSMKATLPSGKAFKASTIDYQPGFGILGIDDEAIGIEPFVYIGFPSGLEAGSHPILPKDQQKVWAHLGVSGGGDAQSGKLVIEDWSSTEAISASFSFAGNDHNGLPFDVKAGSFNINSESEVETIDLRFSAFASLTPELSENTEFKADTISVGFDEVNSAYKIWVTQERDLNGGLSQLGAYFRVSHEGAVNALAVVDGGVYVAQGLNITEFSFEKDVLLSFKFSYSFSLGEDKYSVSEGKLIVDWRLK
ncbi:hypothetical protein [Pseudomonas sp. Teo4]|uniref:hypothetical protein n=1 Tax=Pseudomonas sp. Teo4 TaxID=3064528 RepID=UPI002AB7F5EC|nr:hypothetical protein [Pseudomonas sp. Teo4]MDZ3995504.1 hypothetical protein [Pseudomonas sp. Teo4]